MKHLVFFTLDGEEMVVTDMEITNGTSGILISLGNDIIVQVSHKAFGEMVGDAISMSRDLTNNKKTLEE